MGDHPTEFRQLDSAGAAGDQPGDLGRDREIATLLVALIGEFAAHRDRAAAEVGVPSAQAAALSKIDGPIPMRELADRLACDASNVTGLVDRLAARGLAERDEDPADRRVKRVRLTAAGIELRRRLEESFAHRPTPLARLSEAQREQLRRLLRSAAGAGGQDLDAAVRRGLRALGGALDVDEMVAVE